MASLTTKEYWQENWQKIPLPATYPDDYSHEIIADKFLTIIGQNGKTTQKIIELGGCPGRWANFFNQHFHCRCDVIDFGKNNFKLTKKNYQILGIHGHIFNQDIFSNNLVKNSYDLVLSDGLVEHFSELKSIFYEHVKLLNKNGLLIIGTPNIKGSPFYNYFAKKDWTSYKGHRYITKKQLRKEAQKYHFTIIFCDYLGVINPGIIHWSFIKNRLIKKIIDYSIVFINLLFSKTKIKKESKLFSPYIYLICKKNE